MENRYPQRVNNHQLEESSERYFQSHLPRNWTCEKPSHDYGVDLRVDLFKETDATGLEFLVQLKSSQTSSNLEYETINLATTTYNYLWDKLQVVMLVKFVESDDKAYWELLKNVPKPNMENQTFTVRIPKANDLSSIDWNDIYNYVEKVTDTKLKAMRLIQLQNENV